jgi:hypothetical protein
MSDDNIISFPETAEQAREKALKTPMAPEVFYTFASLVQILGIEDFIVSVDCRFLNWPSGVLVVITDEGEPGVIIYPHLSADLRDEVVAECIERNVQWEIYKEEDATKEGGFEK